MTVQDFGVPDLSSDNFDLLRFPSLSQFGADNDDLNIMERMGSLFDPLIKTSMLNTAQPVSQAPQQRSQLPQAMIQPQTHMHATQSPPHSPHPQQVLQGGSAPITLSQQTQMQSFPQGFVKTSAPQQVLPSSRVSPVTFSSDCAQSIITVNTGLVHSTVMT